MSKFHAKVRVGAKTYNGTTTAKSQSEAYDKIRSAAASRFPNQSIMVMEVKMEKVGDFGLNHLKNLFGFK